MILALIFFKIDFSLDWKEQIKAVSAKASRAIGFLKHAKKFLPRVTLENLYTGIVEPLFGVVVVLVKSSSYRSFKTELLGLLRIAALTP